MPWSAPAAMASTASFTSHGMASEKAAARTRHATPAR
jgi:hypothetical protein